MKIFTLSILMMLLVGVTACGGDRVASHHPEDFVPALQYFDVIDSYGVDTARTPRAELALSPFEYNGLFEVFWQVNSLEDYTVSLKINDRPSLVDSITIHSEVCGENKWCDQAGNLVCEYTDDFLMACENASKFVDILPLFAADINGEPVTPETLYLFLEICDYDSFYCEYDYYPVSMQ